MIRKAKAIWRGTGRAGTGHLSTDSGVLAETPYSFAQLGPALPSATSRKDHADVVERFR